MNRSEINGLASVLVRKMSVLRRLPRVPGRVIAVSLLSCVLASVLVSVSGCYSPLPIPRIEGDLNGWTVPYRGVDGLKIHVFNTGVVRMPQATVYRGGSWTSLERLEVPAFVIEHPKAGLIVFDTGLNPMLIDQAADYLGWWESQVMFFEAERGQSLPEQMLAAGMNPADVGAVLLSHLHYDHTGSIEAFPNATVVLSRAEQEKAGEDPLMSRFIADTDFNDVADWRPLDFEAADPFLTFISHVDLIGDGSLLAVDLHGHTPGSMGVLVRTAEAPVLLTGDAAWVDMSWRYSAQPLFAWDIRLWWEQVWRIRKLAQLEPKLRVIPGHDLDPVMEMELASVILHGEAEEELAAPIATAAPNSPGVEAVVEPASQAAVPPAVQPTGQPAGQ